MNGESAIWQSGLRKAHHAIDADKPTSPRQAGCRVTLAFWLAGQCHGRIHGIIGQCRQPGRRGAEGLGEALRKFRQRADIGCRIPSPQEGLIAADGGIIPTTCADELGLGRVNASVSDKWTHMHHQVLTAGQEQCVGARSWGSIAFNGCKHAP